MSLEGMHGPAWGNFKDTGNDGEAKRCRGREARGQR
jgi:hypothetical protein